MSTPAHLIEPHSTWNVRLGRSTRGLDLDRRITAQKQNYNNTQIWIGEYTKIPVRISMKKFWGGGLNPNPGSTAVSGSKNCSVWPENTPKYAFGDPKIKKNYGERD